MEKSRVLKLEILLTSMVREREILGLLRERPRTMEDLVSALGISRSAINRVLNTLIDEESVFKFKERTREKKPGRPRNVYEINANFIDAEEKDYNEDDYKEISRRIWLACPSCNKVGCITVDKQLMESCVMERGDGLMPVQVFEGEICTHDFEVLVDTKLNQR